MSTQLQLYLVAGLDILLPVIALIILGRRHKFRITAIFGGIAAYFLTCEIIIPLLSGLFSALGVTEAFWASHGAFSELLNVLFNVLFGNLALYFILRFTLKNRSRIYDAMAMGLSYWIYNALRLAISAVSYGRLAYMNSQGRLSEMVTESLTLENLQTYVAELTPAGISTFYVQMIGILSLTFMTMVICLYLYVAVKRSNPKIILYTMLAHFVLLLAMNLALYFWGNLAYVIACVIAAGVSYYAYYRFMQWYREQQKQLAQRKKQYKESLRETKSETEENS